MPMKVSRSLVALSTIVCTWSELAAAGPMPANAPAQRSAGTGSTETPGNNVPTDLWLIPGLELGMRLTDFSSKWSATEVQPALARGVRTFVVYRDALNEGIERLRCEFKDGVLVAMEAEIAVDVNAAAGWTAFISPLVRRFGVPDIEPDTAGIAYPYSEFAVWRGNKSIVITGEYSSLNFRRHNVALVRPDFLPVFRTLSIPELALTEALGTFGSAFGPSTTSASELLGAISVLSESVGKTAPRATGQLDYLKAIRERGRGIQMVISANAGWQDTGLVVWPGNGIAIDAEGSWQMASSWASTGPSGSDDLSGSYKVWADARPSALICKVGKEGVPFAIEDNYSYAMGPGLVGGLTGNLFCAPNDSYVKDNRGTMNVTAVTIPSPFIGDSGIFFPYLAH